MRVKRYIADTMQDAIFKVKAELGSEAIILHTRKIKENSIWGFFGKKRIEVIATVEEEREKHVTKELRQELSTLREKIHELTEAQTNQQNAKLSGEISPQMAQLLYPGRLQDVAEKLVAAGVMLEIICQLCQGVMDRLEVHQLHEETVVSQTMIEEIINLIKITSPLRDYTNKRIVAFVGPTGVGKTTTIAKLAAQIALEGQKTVGLITADTYRIAAVEQLKTYSDIINVPLRVIYNSKDLEQAVGELSACDLVLIDTAGRSQKDQNQMEQLKELLPKGIIDEIHLVVAMNICYEDILESVDKFGELSLSSLIFTKQDESSNKGVLLNILNKTDYQISYITFGQDVPEDIAEADPRSIAEMILKG